MQRRALLSLGGLLLIAGCGGSSTTPGVSLDQVKAYIDAGVLALDAAAQQYEAGPPAPSADNLVLVQNLVASLDTAKTALDGLTAPADYKAGLLEAVSLMQQLQPLVASKLGAAAPYIPLVFAVAQAFINALPPPADAPPTPPAALVRKGMEYHGHHRH